MSSRTILALAFPFAALVLTGCPAVNPNPAASSSAASSSPAASPTPGPSSLPSPLPSPVHDPDSAPVVAGRDGNSLTLMAVSGAEYSLDGTSYQASTSFTGLAPSTAYTVYQRAAATATSPASGAHSLALTTPAQTAVSPDAWAGASWPLGAAANGSNVCFAVYSKDATRVRLEIYDAAYGSEYLSSFDMAKGSDNVWRAEVTGLPSKVYYGFRCWGPNWPSSASWAPGSTSSGYIADVDSSGDRFNPNKLLFDPYARELSHDRDNATALGSENGGMFGTGSATYDGIPRRNFDTGKWAPKAIVVSDGYSFGTKPALAAKDAIIYEAHVRGLTEHPSSSFLKTTILSGLSGYGDAVDVPADYRGTYRGAAYMAGYLKDLGISTIEFLPVMETDNDNNPSTASGGNFWGYMTYGWFAPDRRYAYDKSPGGPTAEFKAMVKAFHDAGLEVYLDVVFNHSGEGGLWGDANTAELTSLRGLDNSEYYALVPSDKTYYWETTGCGNNLRCDNPPVRSLILDSLKYWSETMGVDGFRFDLAPVLGRVSDGTNWNYSSSAQTLTDIASLGSTDNIEMIAEPWDCGTYQVGAFPSGWGEWNGKFRDATRGFFDLEGNLSAVSNFSYASAFYGDYDDYHGRGGPALSVNLIDAHDGFTLTDLVSYNSQTNASLSWPFGPSDGGNNTNYSWDSNGDQSLRRQRIRSLMTWQIFSRGIPMIVYGDEFGRTQNGNNNPYDIDSVATWNNYAMISSDSPDAVSTGTTGAAYHNNLGTDSLADGENNIFLFATSLFNLRKNEPALRQADYSEPITFTKDDGSSGYDSSSDRCVRIVIDGSAVDGTKYCLFVNNKSADDPSFVIPPADTGMKWIRIIDTAAWAEANNNFWTDSSATTITGSYAQKARSITVLKEVAQ